MEVLLKFYKSIKRINRMILDNIVMNFHKKYYKLVLWVYNIYENNIKGAIYVKNKAVVWAYYGI